MNKILFLLGIMLVMVGINSANAKQASFDDMNYSQFLDFCKEHDPKSWDSMPIDERMVSNLCDFQSEGFGEKQWIWLNGTNLDWNGFAQKASEDHANAIPEFVDGGIKETLRIDSIVSGRDSFPPQMMAMISFDYEKFSQVRHYDEKFAICIDGKLVPQDSFIECSDEYIKYDFTKEEPFTIPKFVKKIPLPEHARQQMSDWCQNSPKWANMDKQFWDVIPVRLVSSTDEFQSLQGIKDSVVVNSYASEDTCPPNVWMAGTFTSENGNKHKFSLYHDSDFFRYWIDEVKCKEGFVLVTKSSDASSACVKPETRAILIEIGWAKHESYEVQVTGRDAQKICDVLDWYCAPDQTFNGIKNGDKISVEQRVNDKTYRFTIYPDELCYSRDGWGVSACRTDYPIITISSPDHDPNPRSIILQIGVNNTTYWKNESDVPVILTSEDERWSTGLISPNEGKVIQFNQTAFYKYRGLPPTSINGRIAVISDQTEFLPIQEKLAIAREIIKVEMGNPITGIGIGNADNVLDITIHEDELKKNPDAEEHYKKRYQEMIPFDVPIRIGFGHMEPE